MIRVFLLLLSVLLAGCPLTVVDRGPCRRCERGGDCDDGPDECKECRAEWCPDMAPGGDG